MQLLQDAKTGNGAPSADVCAQAMLDGMPQAVWFIRRHMRRHRKHGLSVTQFRTLVLLDRFPTASLCMVAENLGATAPTASRLVHGLVSKGFVTRKESVNDRRQISLVLTAAGRAALIISRRETQAGLARQIARLGDSERTALNYVMTLVKDLFAVRAIDEEEVGKCESPAKRTGRNASKKSQ